MRRRKSVSRLVEQLRFFGSKKLISDYSKVKPRVRVKIKGTTQDPIGCKNTPREYDSFRDKHLISSSGDNVVFIK